MRKQPLHPHTVTINKAQKNQSKKARLKAVNWLIKRFPIAFNNNSQIRPLKIGIMHDILECATNEAAEAGISKSKLREAVVTLMRRIDYLACLKAREMRIDLEGNPTVPVTEDEAEKASMKIKKRVEKSAKNARRLLTTKTTSFNKYDNTTSVFPSYNSRPPAFSAQIMPSGKVRSSASIVVKRKTSRPYDPEAVARLKQKLDLAQNKE